VFYFETSMILGLLMTLSNV